MVLVRAAITRPEKELELASACVRSIAVVSVNTSPQSENLFYLPV